MIIIALFLLIPNIFMVIPNFFERDIPKEIREQVKAGKAAMIELNREVSLEQDKSSLNIL
jgi:hypothetical protein